MTPTTSGKPAIAGVLARDEAYDRDPVGDPPVSVARYRRALRAALDVPADDAGGVPLAWEGRETAAYAAGRRDAMLEMTRRVALALGLDEEAGAG